MYGAAASRLYTGYLGSREGEGERVSNETEKRMLESYEIIHGIRIGDKEVVFGQDENNSMPYFCAFYASNELFYSYEDCMAGDDYVEMMELFSERVKAQCMKIREEQEKVTVPRERITADMCRQDNRSLDIMGKVVVVRADALRPEYRSAEHQLVLVEGGNGSRGNALGTTCFCKNLYSGESVSWKRYDIQGEVKPEHMPEWVGDKLAELQRQKENPSSKRGEKQEIR